MSDDKYDEKPSQSSSDKEFNKRFGFILKRIEKDKENEAQQRISKENTDLKHGYELDPDSNTARPSPDKAWWESTRIKPVERTFYTFANYTVDEGNKNAFIRLRAWTTEDKKGFFVFGPSGTGKTHLLKALLNKNFRQGTKSWYVDAKKLIKEVLGKDKWTDKPTSVYDRQEIAIKKYSDPKILVIDDIQRFNETDFQNDFLKDLLDERLQPGKITFAACDLGREEIRNHFHPRVLDRINAHCTLVSIRGNSKRGRL